MLKHEDVMPSHLKCVELCPLVCKDCGSRAFTRLCVQFCNTPTATGGDPPTSFLDLNKHGIGAAEQVLAETTSMLLWTRTVICGCDCARLGSYSAIYLPGSFIVGFWVFSNVGTI